MALSIDGTGNGTIGNLSVTTATGNIVSSGDSGTITNAMINDGTIEATKLSGGQTGSAPAFTVRAWVNFNGTGTVAIRDSGNVSSITDNGAGNYTVNFTTAMPHANYSVGASWAEDNNHTTTGSVTSGRIVNSYATGSVRFHPVQFSSNFYDCQLLSLMVIG